MGGASGLVTSGYLSAGSATSLTSLNAIFFSTGRDFCMSLKKGPGTEWLMEVSGGGGNSSPGLVDVGEALTQVELDVVSGTLNAGTVYAFERV